MGRGREMGQRERLEKRREGKAVRQKGSEKEREEERERLRWMQRWEPERD